MPPEQLTSLAPTPVYIDPFRVPALPSLETPVAHVDSPATDMLWLARDCPPLSREEVSAATLVENETPHCHLAAAVILHCLGRTGTILVAREARNAVMRLPTAPMLGRAALLSRLTDMMPHATLYDRVLAEVRAHDQVFRARYFIDGDPLEDYLTALEIQTDAVKSPAIACIRDVRLSETTRVRDAAARAEWTLRHMLLEAFVDAPSAS